METTKTVEPKPPETLESLGYTDISTEPREGGGVRVTASHGKLRYMAESRHASGPNELLELFEAQRGSKRPSADDLEEAERLLRAAGRTVGPAPDDVVRPQHLKDSVTSGEPEQAGFPAARVEPAAVAAVRGAGEAAAAKVAAAAAPAKPAPKAGRGS